MNETIRQQMRALVADQFYHQPGDIIQIHREELIDMLTKQTEHGISLGNSNF